MTAHWGVPDPAAVQGTEESKRKAFLDAYTVLQRRISLFVNLPFDKLRGLALKERLSQIGRAR
jgi:arsenate reductase